MNKSKFRNPGHRLRGAALLTGLALVAGARIVGAADFDEVDEVTAADGMASDFFGHAVAIDGNTAVVGANEHDHGPAKTGGAYVFGRDASGTWSQVAELDPLDRAADDLFGYSVAVSGDTVVVCATDDDDGGSSSGSAYVFIDNGGTWPLQQKLTTSSTQANDRFGISVAVDDDTVMVASSKRNSGASESGAVFVFERNMTGTWTERVPPLTPSDPGLFAHFGSSVSIDGDIALIGAKDDGDNGFQAGAAYVFVRDASGAWSEHSKLMAPAMEVTHRDQFGASVAVSGDTALIGVQTSDLAVHPVTGCTSGCNAGSAYIFVRDPGGTWQPQGGMIRGSDTDADHQFGISVSVSGNRALIGASGGNAFTGSAYIFERDVNGTWSEQQRLVPDTTGGVYGFSVGISGHRAVVSDKFSNLLAFRAGSAHILESASAEDQLQGLTGDLIGLDLHDGIENALLAKLNAAFQALEAGNDQAAINSLNAFINQVNAQSGKKISIADAMQQIAAAEEIIDLILNP